MSRPFSSALRCLPLLAMLFLLGAHSLSGGHRFPARVCDLGGKKLLLFPAGSRLESDAPVVRLDAPACETAPSALLLLDELPAFLRAPLFSAAESFAYVGERVAPPGLRSAARISGAPPAQGWPVQGTWVSVSLAPPGEFAFPVEDDLDATPASARAEGNSLRVQWLNAKGEAAAILCDLPALGRCEPAPAVATPEPLLERARSFAQACENTWRAGHRARRALAACALARWNRMLASCPASLSAEEEHRLGAELASVPFYRWRRPQLDSMRECPALSRIETVQAFLEMRLGKTLD